MWTVHHRRSCWPQWLGWSYASIAAATRVSWGNDMLEVQTRKSPHISRSTNPLISPGGKLPILNRAIIYHMTMNTKDISYWEARKSTISNLGDAELTHLFSNYLRVLLFHDPSYRVDFFYKIFFYTILPFRLYIWLSIRHEDLSNAAMSHYLQSLSVVPWECPKKVLSFSGYILFH